MQTFTLTLMKSIWIADQVAKRCWNAMNQLAWNLSECYRFTYVTLYTWLGAVWHLNLWTGAVLVIFSTAAFLTGLALAEQINHQCATFLGVSLAPRRKIPNHSFPFLDWHTEARARTRLVSYKRETGRGNWGGEQQIHLITQNIPFLLVSSSLGMRTFWLFSGVICQTKSSAPFMSNSFQQQFH